MAQVKALIAILETQEYVFRCNSLDSLENGRKFNVVSIFIPFVIFKNENSISVSRTPNKSSMILSHTYQTKPFDHIKNQVAINLIELQFAFSENTDKGHLSS